MLFLSMIYTHQQLMNDSIRYWSDNTLSLADFGGEYGFHKLVNSAIVEFDYKKWEYENRGEPRWFLATNDNIFKERFAGSLGYKRPTSYNPAPNGMLHVWDIIMGKWTTVKIDDYGRIEVKSIFPMSLTARSYVQDERALSKFFTFAQLFDYKVRVFNKDYDNFRKMPPAQKLALIEEQRKIMTLQEHEAQQRELIKQEIDAIIDEKLGKGEEEETPKPENPLDKLKITNLTEQDTKQTMNSIGRLNITKPEAPNQNQNVVQSLYAAPQTQNENVMENFNNGKNRSI